MKIAVKNFDNKHGEGARSPRGDLLLPLQGAPDPHCGAGVPRRAARRHPQDQDAQRGVGRRQEALEAEGHRTGAHRVASAARSGARAARFTDRCRATTAKDLSTGEKKNALKSGALAQGEGGAASSSSRASPFASHKTQELEAILAKVGAEGKILLVDARDNRESGAGVAQPSADQDRRRAGGQRLRRRRPAVFRGQRAGARAPRGGSGSMRIQEIIRRPLITEKSSRAAREHERARPSKSISRANKIEIQRAVEAQFKVKVAEVRVAKMHGKVRRQGRFAGRRPDWKKAYVRLAPGEKTDRLLRRRVRKRAWDRWVFVNSDLRTHRAGSRASRTSTRSRRAGRSSRSPAARAAPAAATTRASSPPGSAAAATSGATASIDFKRDKHGVPGKVASIEYDPNRSARIALIHYADGEKRYILAPEGLAVGDGRGVRREGRDQPRQRAAAAADPARHGDPQHRAQARQGRADGPLRRRRRAADGARGRARPR